MLPTDKHTLPKDKALALVSRFYDAILGENKLDFSKAQLCVLVHIEQVLLLNPEYWLQVQDAVNEITFEQFVEFKRFELCK
jgi:hypothetical protein